MSWQAWLIFVPACIGMNFFPGPNNMLALVNATQAGSSKAIVAGLARLPIMVIMLILLAAGLEVLMEKSADMLTWIRWIGAGYLVWMGWQAWRSANVAIELEQVQDLSLRAMAIREGVVASTNPKLILIFTAFFPQFLVVDQDPIGQIFWMGLTFILIEVGAIAAYAGGGHGLRSWLDGDNGNRILKRGTGVALWGAAGAVLAK